MLQPNDLLRLITSLVRKSFDRLLFDSTKYYFTLVLILRLFVLYCNMTWCNVYDNNEVICLCRA